MANSTSKTVFYLQYLHKIDFNDTVFRKPPNNAYFSDTCLNNYIIINLMQFTALHLYLKT